MDMPPVRECLAEDCAYNRAHMCHALAITVGGKSHPKCDTYTRSDEKAGAMDSTGAVGACKTSSCRHNQELECRAQGISVGKHFMRDYDCKTYEKG